MKRNKELIIQLGALFLVTKETKSEQKDFQKSMNIAQH